MDLESTSIYQYAAPTSACLEPLESLKPIITPGYELRLRLINMVQDQPFSGKDDENPYSHLNKFEQTCACLCITGMLDETYGNFFLSLWQEKLNVGIISP